MTDIILCLEYLKYVFHAWTEIVWIVIHRTIQFMCIGCCQRRKKKVECFQISKLTPIKCQALKTCENMPVRLLNVYIPMAQCYMFIKLWVRYGGSHL
jgi:hypothetical protein